MKTVAGADNAKKIASHSDCSSAQVPYSIASITRSLVYQTSLRVLEKFGREALARENERSQQKKTTREKRGHNEPKRPPLY